MFSYEIVKTFLIIDKTLFLIFVSLVLYTTYYWKKIIESSITCHSIGEHKNII